MKKIALYPHSGSLNHGCEAIIRSTSGILRNVIPDSTINLYSSDYLSDEKFLSGVVDNIKSIYVSRTLNKKLTLSESLRFKFYHVFSKERADKLFYYRAYKDTPIITDNDLYIAIGGDVYCYGENESYTAINRHIRERRKPNVLWGCSVGESDLTPSKIKDIKGYDLLIPRESITLETLSKVADTKRIRLHRDPAFSLKTELLPLPEGFIEGNTVGVNISPLISKYETDLTRGIGVESVYNMIEYILENTDSAVALIPHVMESDNNDYELMSKICEKYKDTGRVIIIDAREMNAEQIKGYIARCRVFVGARTHATIAAYSSLVPTLVIGYSVKAIGIARDIFGTEDGLVLPIQSIKDKTELTFAFKELMKNEDKYRQRLCEVIPSFIDSARSAGDELLSFIE